MTYLELRNVDKKYTTNGPMIVNKMNLTIEQGEFVVFLGPSGCGKTTTIRMISGLEEVSGGDILIDGESVLSKKPKDRNVSMIFQSYAIWPHMTVYDNIAYPLKLQKVPKAEIKQRVEAAARATNIENLLDRFPHAMSGGQRQRVAVSRAIVVRPKLFLMDEPLSNLDAKLRITMRTELKDIHLKENATTIFVTHDQAEAMSLADRIVVMNNGVIEQMGKPMEIYHDSETKFVASFIGTPPTNFFEVEIKAEGSDLIAEGDGITYRIPEKLHSSLSTYLNQTVDLGVRPEFIEVLLNDQPHDNIIAESEVLFVEPQGSHSIIVTSINQHEVKIVSTEIFELERGAKMRLTISNDDVMFFDKTTEKRIR